MQLCILGVTTGKTTTTVESLNNGHIGNKYKFKWFVHRIEVVYFKRFQSHYIDRGLKFGDLVLSIVERYLIQCPFLGVSVKRDSTVTDAFPKYGHIHISIYGYYYSY